MRTSGDVSKAAFYSVSFKWTRSLPISMPYVRFLPLLKLSLFFFCPAFYYFIFLKWQHLVPIPIFAPVSYRDFLRSFCFAFPWTSLLWFQDVVLELPCSRNALLNWQSKKIIPHLSYSLLVQLAICALFLFGISSVYLTGFYSGFKNVKALLLDSAQTYMN